MRDIAIRIEGEVAFVPLTQGLTAVIDAADVQLVAGVPWHAERRQHLIYAAWTDTRRRRHVSMHRLILGRREGFDVDHIDGNGLNNRRGNLRLCTRSQNIANKRASKSNRLGVKGVWFQGGKYRACIYIDGKTHHLGGFETVSAAAAAYHKAAVDGFDEFARAE